MRVYYSIEFLNVLCYEDFDSKDEMEKWVSKHQEPEYEIIDIQEN